MGAAASHRMVGWHHRVKPSGWQGAWDVEIKRWEYLLSSVVFVQIDRYVQMCVYTLIFLFVLIESLSSRLEQSNLWRRIDYEHSINLFNILVYCCTPYECQCCILTPCLTLSQPCSVMAVEEQEGNDYSWICKGSFVVAASYANGRRLSAG